MKSMGSGWENLEIQLALKGLINIKKKFDPKYCTHNLHLVSSFGLNYFAHWSEIFIIFTAISFKQETVPPRNFNFKFITN